MDWKDINKEKPIDYKNCTKFEDCEVLVSIHGVIEFDTFQCGNLPEPWWKFEYSHKAFVSHWIKKDDIEHPNPDNIETAKEPFETVEDKSVLCPRCEKTTPVYFMTENISCRFCHEIMDVSNNIIELKE